MTRAECEQIMRSIDAIVDWDGKVPEEQGIKEKNKITNILKRKIEECCDNPELSKEGQEIYNDIKNNKNIKILLKEISKLNSKFEILLLLKYIKKNTNNEEDFVKILLEMNEWKKIFYNISLYLVGKKYTKKEIAKMI